MIDYKFSKVVFERTYQDTLSILLKSESFLKAFSDRPINTEHTHNDLRINCEMTRVTARVSQVMAWLLAQKAAYAGEITFEEANSPRYRIEEDPFCMVDSLDDPTKDLPLPVKNLLQESYSLYKRVLVIAQQQESAEHNP
jgi:regulator of CtrA degradation